MIKSTAAILYMFGTLVALILSLFGGVHILLMYVVYAAVSIAIGSIRDEDSINRSGLYMIAIALWLLPAAHLISEAFWIAFAPGMNATRPVPVVTRNANEDDIKVEAALTEVDTSNPFFVARLNLRIKNDNDRWAYVPHGVSCEFDYPIGMRRYFWVTDTIDGQQDLRVSFRIHRASFTDGHVPSFIGIRGCEAGRSSDHANRRLTTRFGGAQ
jgi:hypothetical protein